jgi:hypothetical protein
VHVSEWLRRIGLAFKCFFMVLFTGRLPPELSPAGPATEAAVDGPPPESRVPASAPAVQLLALLQRDGRLVDFLCEDIGAYPDDQVGAAVREVHAASRQVLLKYIGLEPILPGEEGQAAVVEPGFDPAEVKLVGQLAGRPPFRGVLRHRGWRASRVNLPSAAGGSRWTVVAPAEVELG